MNQNKFSTKRDVTKREVRAKFPATEAELVLKIKQLTPNRPDVLQSTDTQRVVYLAQMELLRSILRVVEDEV